MFAIFQQAEQSCENFDILVGLFEKFEGALSALKSEVGTPSKEWSGCFAPYSSDYKELYRAGINGTFYSIVEIGLNNLFFKNKK